MIRYIFAILLILFSLNIEAQTHLHPLAQNFANDEITYGSYAMRGIDLQKIQHESIDLGDVNDLGTTFSSITSTYFNPSIGNTLTSLSYDLIHFSTNQITWTGSPTANDGYVTFNGTSQYGLLTPNSLYFPSGGNSFTMSIWFSMASNFLGDVWGFGTNDGPGTRIAIINYTVSNKLGVEWAGDGRGFVWTYDNLWHNITVTYSGGSTATGLLIYFDGILQTTSVLVSSDVTLNISYSDNGCAIIGGAPYYGGVAQFPGNLALPFVTLSVLNSTQVLSLYNLGVLSGY